MGAVSEITTTQKNVNTSFISTRRVNYYVPRMLATVKYT